MNRKTHWEHPPSARTLEVHAETLLEDLTSTLEAASVDAGRILRGERERVTAALRALDASDVATHAPLEAAIVEAERVLALWMGES